MQTPIFIIHTKGGGKMLKIVTEDGLIPLDADIHIKHKNNGMKTLDFKISIHHPLYYLLTNEKVLEFDGLYFLIKLNDDAENGTDAMIEAQLDTDDFKKHFFKHFLAETKTLYEILEIALNGTGWSIRDGFSRDIRRTIDIENCVAIDVVNECMNMFDVLYDFDNKGKILTIIDPNIIMDKGFYITDQLNLTNINYTSDTYDFCTCLKCYGKTNEETGEELTFSAINNGNDYIKNNEYSDKTVWGSFKDDRFEIEESLLEAGITELKRRANPVTSYSLTIVNLSKLLPEKYFLLNFELNDIVTLKDKIRKKEVVERIIEYDEYPEHPENDVITLSDQPLSIVDLESNIYDRIVNISNDVDRIKGTFLKEAKEISTSIINEWAEKGQIYMNQNEIYILDRMPKELAKFVIRINLGGIAFSQNGWQGPYISAWTIDGKFNADFITAGVIRGIQLIGNTISNGNSFYVDQNGNMTCNNATINSGIFKGDINTSRNIHVGNDIYIGNPQEAQFKHIIFKDTADSDMQIRFMKTGSAEDSPLNNSIDINNTNNGFSNIVEFFGNHTVLINRKPSGEVGVIDLDPIGWSMIDNNLSVFGGLNVFGNKARVVETQNFGKRTFNALETPTALFEENGSALLNEEGICMIFINDIVYESTNSKCAYFVHLTKCGTGDVYCDKKNETYFIVKGTPGLIFDWCIKIKQKGYETADNDEFLEDPRDTIGTMEKILNEDYQKNTKKNSIFEEEVNSYYENYIKKMEVMI